MTISAIAREGRGEGKDEARSDKDLISPFLLKGRRWVHNNEIITARILCYDMRRVMYEGFESGLAEGDKCN